MNEILDKTITFVDIDDPVVKAKLDTLEMIPEPCILITEDRAIVWYNQNFYDKYNDVLANINGDTMAMMMGCVNSKAVSEVNDFSHCEDCPIYIAQNLLTHGCTNEQRGSISLPAPWGKHEINIDLVASYMELEGQRFILMCIKNNDNEIVHYQLNREFFHDLLNILQRMNSSLNLANMVIEDTKKDGYRLPTQLNTELNMLSRAITVATDLIGTQRLLHNAHTNTLILNEASFAPAQILQQLMGTVEKLEASNSRHIIVAPGPTNIICEGDCILIKQALYSLLYSIIFASRAGQFIEVGYDIIGENLQFWIRNRELIINETKLEQFRTEYTFRRLRNTHAFTIELLAVRHLKGVINITSEADQGTKLTFTLQANPHPASGEEFQ